MEIPTTVQNVALLSLTFDSVHQRSSGKVGQSECSYFRALGAFIYIILAVRKLVIGLGPRAVGEFCLCSKSPRGRAGGR